MLLNQWSKVTWLQSPLPQKLGSGTNTNSNIPIQVSSISLVFSADNGIEQTSMMVFPNPCDGKFTLALSSEKGRLEICSCQVKWCFILKSQIRDQ